jgi:hypothetical protein
VSGESLDEERARLERRASATRARLLGAIDALEKRGHDVIDPRVQLRKHPEMLPVVAASAALVAGVALGASLYAAQSRRQHIAGERLHALARAWEHPERVAPSSRHPVLSLAGKVALGVAVLMAFERSRKAMTTGLAFALEVVNGDKKAQTPAELSGQVLADPAQGDRLVFGASTGVTPPQAR